jgi:5-methylcytosine-specific restriction endonuclease McrA
VLVLALALADLDARTRPVGLAVTVLLVLALAVPRLTRPRTVARTRVRARLARAPRRAPSTRPPGRPAIPAAIKRAVWERDRGRCRYCNLTDQESVRRYGQHLHLDHVYPYSRGGPSTVANLALACPRCNLRKGARLDIRPWPGGGTPGRA